MASVVAAVPKTGKLARSVYSPEVATVANPVNAEPSPVKSVAATVPVTVSTPPTYVKFEVPDTAELSCQIAI